MSKLVKKLKKAISDKLNPDGSAPGEEDMPLAYDADELRETLKDFQESPTENPPSSPESYQLWNSIGSANRLVEAQMKRDGEMNQYWMDQIRDLMEKLEAAEDAGDTRKIGQYLGLLKEFSIRTRNTALDQFVEDKQRDLFLP